MTLETALDGIAATKYYSMCGMTYTSLKRNDSHLKTYAELSPSMQLGVKRMIKEVYKIQRLVFHYEIDYLINCMREVGIKVRRFFEGCDLNAAFYSNKSIPPNNRNEWLLRIHYQFIKLLNRLFDYLLGIS